jgi:hypothetical protein
LFGVLVSANVAAVKVVAPTSCLLNRLLARASHHDENARLAKPARSRVLRVVTGLSLAAMLSCGVWPTRAHAWLLPEHRNIGVQSWKLLPPASQRYYAALWSEARSDSKAKFCGTPWMKELGMPPCIDFPAWAGLAGDHSCSPRQLVDKTLTSDWVIDVIAIGQDLQQKLARVKRESDRENIWTTSNLALQSADPEYATRAGANNAHFVLPSDGVAFDAFLSKTDRAGAPLNAHGLYVYYHSAAISLARALASTPPNQPGRAERAREVLALEAYALHFLEDIYSSGHVAGSWGDLATRKGTHDYYCGHGIGEVTWSGRPIVMYGDAHMQPEDLSRTTKAVALSLQQVAEAAASPSPESAADLSLARRALGLDSCQEISQPEPLPLSAADREQLRALLLETPQTGYGADSVALPRFRSDFGLFLGLHAEAALGPVYGGYGDNQVRGVGQLAIAARIGFGLENVVGSVNSGTMFLQGGLAMQSAQDDGCQTDGCQAMLFGSKLLPRVPARLGLDLGIRLPFWLIPGDMILLAPILAAVSTTALASVAMAAASGGLIPWQRTFATPIGWVEFTLGRQLGVTLFGLIGQPTVGWAQRSADGVTLPYPMTFRSIQLTFPIVEYTPFRTVSQNLTSELRFELLYSIDIPFDSKFWNPRTGQELDEPGPSLDAAHMVLLRMSVDGRTYL